MDPHTLNALNLSIAHWERLASGKRNQGETVDVDGCALCGMFNTPIKDMELKCVGCPVFEKTGNRFCKETPFVHAESMVEDADRIDRPINLDELLDSDEFKNAAEAELEFLKSLLPVEPPSV